MREHADVVFPAEAYAEKEGTLTHPDGRLQRLRPAIGRPQPAGAGHRRAPGLAGHRRRRRARRATTSASPPGRWPRAQLFEAVPFYAGLTLDEIGGRGVRWPEREAARQLRGADAWEPVHARRPAARRARRRRARCGSAPTARCGLRKEVDLSPALHFLRAAPGGRALARRRRAARRSRDGDQVEVGSNGTRVRGAVRLRAAIPRGTVFLAEGTHEDAANVLTDAARGDRAASAARPSGAGAAAAQVAPAGEGRAEMPPSAPLPIPPTGPSQSGHDA